ncbi:hypothetical protein COL5a_007253 [Colletotrichum fioriniae]|nr:hypothetical protein COL5a_007253 [Colletotrichum fioriniae]
MFNSAEVNEPVPDPLEPPLCNEQQEAMNLAMAGHNLFITGSGGCGKSVLVKALQTNFEAKHKDVHLIAPTGLAALNINGRTAFNYAGWVPDDKKKSFDAIVEKSKGEIFDRFRSTDVLIIDEIRHPKIRDNEKWAFKSTAWEECKFKYVHLRKIHRQKDEEFVSILQKCRLGKALDASDISTLLHHPTEVENGARLYSKREEVDELNDLSFKMLPGSPRKYKCLDVYKPSESDVGDGPEFYALFSRTQIPLAPGWAMTIHKSQGMSLDRLIVNLGSVFEKGQAYVALSRARSLKGREIEGATRDELRDSLRVDLEVKKFLERLEGTGKGKNPEPRNTVDGGRSE